VANESEKPYLADQVRARAVVVLTRRSDLTIVETKKDTGLDFHVYIERDDRAMRLMFGVLLRGVPSPVTPQGASAVLQPTMAQFAGMGKFLYPVCLLFFTMREEQEFFAWLAEPVQTPGGPKLVHHQKARCVELTDEVLDGAVEQIVGWYDAVAAVLVA
jgi:hypothetical protein